MKKHAKGKALESTINRVNMRYRTSGQALIIYNGTPINITASGVQLCKAKPDFEGLLRGGTYIVFDAKESADKTSLPLVNLREHQVEYLKMVDRLGGIAFFLVHFYKLYPDKAYKIPIKFILPYWEKWKYEKGRASIPIKDLTEDMLVEISNYLGLEDGTSRS